MLNDPRMLHIVVLMMENRSFDHMLGLLKAEIPEICGVSPGLYSNADAVGVDRPVTDDAVSQGQFGFDPGHDFSDVFLQMYGTEFDGTPGGTPHMSGFVRRYEQQAGAGPGAAVMRCFRPEQVPALATLARNYAVCDQWFSSVPCPPLRVGADAAEPDVRTFRDLVRPARHVARLFPREAEHLSAAEAGREARKDLLLREVERPEYSFIEPAYQDNNDTGELATDQHPDHDVRAGDQFIRAVYEAIRSNEACWKSTLLLVVWDEHGGMFDHEIPPIVLPDDFASTSPAFAFDRLGVRVPAVVVSPYVDAQVDHLVYEHASIPATVTAQCLGDPKMLAPYSRERHANTFGQLLTRDRADPRGDTPDFDAAAAAVGPAAALRMTGGDAASTLHVNQVREIHALLMRNHPDVARDLHPEAVKTEADAKTFIEIALEIVHAEPV